jgi:hypothetical protein
VTVTLSQGNIPLPARGVRFSQVSGSFTFLPLGSGVVEQAGASFVATTDETGKARAKILATALAPNQTALIRVTDLGSGAYRDTSFAIAQYTGNTPSFFTLPSAITFTGPYTDVCASGASSQVAIFGGTPPYTVVGGSSAFSVLPGVVAASGGTFIVTLAPVPNCLTNAPIGVTDATGRTITLTISSVAGTGTAPAPAISVAPNSLVLACSFTVPAVPPATPTTVAVTSSVTVSGGSGTFSAGSNHPRVLATVTDRTVTIQRLASDPLAATYPTTGTVTVTDGATSAAVALTVPTYCP